MKIHILVVEDQASNRDLICEVLSEEGYETLAVETLAKARNALKNTVPDLIILDRILPDGDSLGLCNEIRNTPKMESLPILFLTATKKTAADRIIGIEKGADDYLAKPFNLEELAVRVKALLRRSGKLAVSAIQSAGVLKVDHESRRAYLKDHEIALSGKEFDLLWFLMQRRGRVNTREQLLLQIWGYEAGLELDSKVLDVTVNHLRNKLGKAADMIVAVRGQGYRFDAPESK